MTESKTEIGVSFLKTYLFIQLALLLKKWVILCSVGLSCPLLALSLGNQTQPSSIDLSQCPLLFFYFLFFKVLSRRAWFETPYVAKDDLESLNLPLPPKHWSPVHTRTHVYDARNTPQAFCKPGKHVASWVLSVFLLLSFKLCCLSVGEKYKLFVPEVWLLLKFMISSFLTLTLLIVSFEEQKETDFVKRPVYLDFFPLLVSYSFRIPPKRSKIMKIHSRVFRLL